MASKRILMIVGDFVEDYEAMVPFQTLLTFGHKVDAVCPEKRSGDVVATAVHDFEGHQTYTEKPGHQFRLNADFESVVPSTYDGLVIPGGRSPEYLRLDARVLDMVRHFASANKPIGAICHGQLVLATAGVLEGRTCQSYPAIRPDLEAAGCQWDEPSEALDSVCIDGNLITAPAWPAHPVWLRSLLDLLG